MAVMRKGDRRNDIKFWGWDKKKRTMQRFVKNGNIFCFQLDDNRYCFGRIIAKLLVGHVAELFGFLSPRPEITEDATACDAVAVLARK